MGYKKPGKATFDVLTERNRQMTAEGFSEEADDLQTEGQIAAGAAAYLLHASGRPELAAHVWKEAGLDPTMFKPAEPRRDIIKAAAMSIAEIERLDRLEAQNAKSV